MLCVLLNIFAIFYPHEIPRYGAFIVQIISPLFHTLHIFLPQDKKKMLIGLRTNSLDYHQPMKTNRCKKRTWQIQIYHTREKQGGLPAIFCLRVAKGGWVDGGGGKSGASLSAAGVHTRKRESVCSQQGVSLCVTQCTGWHTLSHPPTYTTSSRQRNRRYWSPAQSQRLIIQCWHTNQPFPCIGLPHTWCKFDASGEIAAPRWMRCVGKKEMLFNIWARDCRGVLFAILFLPWVERCGISAITWNYFFLMLAFFGDVSALGFQIIAITRGQIILLIADLFFSWWR